MVQTIAILALLGLCAGSFINALVWRLHEQTSKKAKKGSLSILSGRSMCVHCRHELAWYDLVPVVSWLLLRRRCRYCNKPISIQYPLVEAITALTFALSYVFWPSGLGTDGQWLLFITWLVCATGLIALAVYDLLWMLLPNKIIYPTLLAALVGRTAYIAAYEPRPVHAVLLWIFSVIIASGVFYILFIVSKGKWIGYGDVRLGLITGTLLADPEKSLAMLFLASVLGTIVVLPALSKGNKQLSSKLPYGPFLIAGTAIMVLFGESLLNWYKGLIL